MKIHAHIIAFNEEKILPFTLDYYSSICEKIFVYDNMSTDSSDEIYKKYEKVEVIKWDSNNEINEFNYTKIKSYEYRNRSRGQKVDWVITCDCDEFIYHPNLIDKLKHYSSVGVTVVKTSGHEMVSNEFPKYDNTLLPNKIKIGSEKLKMLSKSIIFNPEINIEFDAGAHNFSSDNTILSDTDEIKILHYKGLGENYVKEIYENRAKRLSQTNKTNGWGTHYFESEKFILLMRDILKKNKNIVDVI
jgi:Glycosyl transferase family 2